MGKYQLYYKATLFLYCLLCLSQLDSLQLVNITPPIPSVSPRFGGAINISLVITPDIANGEIGFTSNQTVVATEPEDSNTTMVYQNAFFY